MNAKRTALKDAIKQLLVAQGWNDQDAGYLAVCAESEIHVSACDLADQAKNDDDARYGYDDDDGLSDAEADSMTLASAGYGTDEDYGFFGDYPETD